MYVHGEVLDDRFREVLDVFSKNFDDGEEKEGAAFAVFFQGELVVHAWGGWRNRKKAEEWTEDTMNILFSTTKCLSAIALAYVLQENNVGYDEKVTRFWPEFGRYDKENLTISNICLHQAGVLYGSTPLTVEDFLSTETMSKWLEEASPVWPPGSKSGYHALSIGLLIDQLVRRIDPARRSVAHVIRDLTRARGIEDLSIGLQTTEDNERVATLVDPNEEDLKKEAEKDPESLRRYNLGYNKYNDRLYEVFPWILPSAEDYNKLSNRMLPMPSNMGIGSAKAFAEFLSHVSQGEILSPSFLSQMSSPVLVDELDVVNGYPENKGFGFQYTRNSRGQWIFGHSGLGGQNIRIDHHNKLAFVYLTNGMKVADADLVRPFARLQQAVYRCLPQRPLQN